MKFLKKRAAHAYTNDNSTHGACAGGEAAKSWT